MGQLAPPAPVLLVMAAFSRHGEALDWAQVQAQRHWGPVSLVSPRFEFTETDYYQPTMGSGILKQFVAFAALVDPAQLANFKLQTNAWEEEYARQAGHAEPRPLNLDPGYVTLAKLVLASTKDHAHRIYLQQAIFAEVTLLFQHGRWQVHPWTFPDYRRADYHAFFNQCRNYLRRQLRAV